MPIKFRCQHCRQFLGISRTRAGQLVDCPTCGRTLRVPNLDGTLEPIPEPKLNVAELAGALNELARIGEEGADEREDQPHSENVAAPVEVKELAPLPMPEPVSVEPEIPAEKVDLQKERAMKELAAMATAEGASAKDVQAEFARVHQQLSPTSFPRVLRLPAVMASLVGIAVVMFALGWFVGGLGVSETPAETNGEGTTTATGPQETVVTKTVYHTSDWKPAFKGHVMYLAGGTTKPDAGARILVLPDNDKSFNVRLPASGLQPGLDPENSLDHQMAVAGLQALGGNTVVADDKGYFEIELPPTAGRFVLVAISRFATNDFETEIPAGVRNSLQRYVDQPNSLVKMRKLKSTGRKFDGETTQSWTPEFE